MMNDTATMRSPSNASWAEPPGSPDCRGMGPVAGESVTVDWATEAPAGAIPPMISAGAGAGDAKETAMARHVSATALRITWTPPRWMLPDKQGSRLRRGWGWHSR